MKVKRRSTMLQFISRVNLRQDSLGPGDSSSLAPDIKLSTPCRDCYFSTPTRIYSRNQTSTPLDKPYNRGENMCRGKENTPLTLVGARNTPLTLVKLKNNVEWEHYSPQVDRTKDSPMLKKCRSVRKIFKRKVETLRNSSVLSKKPCFSDTLSSLRPRPRLAPLPGNSCDSDQAHGANMNNSYRNLRSLDPSPGCGKIIEPNTSQPPPQRRWTSTEDGNDIFVDPRLTLSRTRVRTNGSLNPRHRFSANINSRHLDLNLYPSLYSAVEQSLPSPRLCGQVSREGGEVEPYIPTVFRHYPVIPFWESMGLKPIPQSPVREDGNLSLDHLIVQAKKELADEQTLLRLAVNSSWDRLCLDELAHQEINRNSRRVNLNDEASNGSITSSSISSSSITTTSSSSVYMDMMFTLPRPSSSDYIDMATLRT